MPPNLSPACRPPEQQRILALRGSTTIIIVDALSLLLRVALGFVRAMSADEARASPGRAAGGLALDGARIHDEVLDALECTVCQELMHEPVTTPCGHSFCRACLRRSVDHSTHCPVCRTILLLSTVDELPVTITLSKLMEKLLPTETARRREAAAREAGLGEARESVSGPWLPLFVMSQCFPGDEFELNIFEPRYRLLVRRAMAGTRRFGMIGHDDGNISAVGCEVEITRCEAIPDGRFHVACVGRTPFAIRDVTTQDGYALAAIMYHPTDLTDEQANEYMMDDGSEDSYETGYDFSGDPVGSARARFRRFRSGLDRVRRALPEASRRVLERRKISPTFAEIDSGDDARRASFRALTTDQVLLRAGRVFAEALPDALALAQRRIQRGEAGECESVSRAFERSFERVASAFLHWTKKGAATDDPDAHAWGMCRAASAAEDLPSGDFSTAVAFLAANSAKERAVFLYERLNDIRDYFAMEEEMRESAEAGEGGEGEEGGEEG